MKILTNKEYKEYLKLKKRATPLKPTELFYEEPVLGESISEYYKSKRCPICNEIVWIEFLEDRKKYCPSCGQSIDWSNKKE